MPNLRFALALIAAALLTLSARADTAVGHTCVGPKGETTWPCGYATSFIQFDSRESPAICAPCAVFVGETFKITWNGSDGELDFISIDEEGWPESRYGASILTGEDRSGQLRAPDFPGNYLLRYHAGDAGYPVLASARLPVRDVGAKLFLLSTVEAGGEFDVVWTGPSYEGDFISLDEVGAEDHEFGPHAFIEPYTPIEEEQQSEVWFRAPDLPGQYEVRYHLGRTSRVIGRFRLQVGVTLEAPAQATSGSFIEVVWKGPSHGGDFVSIDPAGADPQKFGPNAPTHRGNPLILHAVVKPGSYEIRYHLGSTGAAIGQALPLEVTAPETAVSKPSPPAGSN